MMAANIGLLAELLESILQDNRELLLELNVHNVISTGKMENPNVTGLEIGPDLRVNAEKLPAGPASQFGLASMIFTIRDYLEVFVGASESKKLLGNAISGFVRRHDPEALARITEAFPDLLSMGKHGPDPEIDKLDDLGKIREFFAHVIRQAAATGRGNMGAEALAYLKQCASIKAVSDDLGHMEFADGVTPDTALDILSDAVEKLGIPPESVKAILGVYGSMPDDLGITSRLFGGALSKTNKFGCPPIDRLLRDGIDRDSSLLMEGPAGVEKEVLAALFAREGLKRNGCVIIVGSACSVECIRRGLISPDLADAESHGRLIFVDWHSRFVERVTSIDVSGNVLKVSNDLTNLAVGIDMALKMAGAHPQVRLVLDMASSTIVTEGFDRVHEFLNSVRANMKNHSCTGLVLLNPQTQPSDQTGILEEIFDGTMKIERYVEHGQLRSSFRVARLSGMAFSSSGLTLSITQRGMEISEGGEGVTEAISFEHDDEKSVMGLPGLESLSPGGLPMGKSFLVWMPSSIMPADFVKPVVMEAQKEGQALLLAMSSVNTDTMGEWMSEKGLSRKGLIDRGLLQIVDWYGQKSAKVLGMEFDEGIIRTSRDLTHLGVGMDHALGKISDRISSLAVMEVFSQAVRLFELRAVYAFAQSMSAKLSDRGFTSFMLMERNAHDPMVNAAMEELFDGIIDIKPVGDSLELALVSVRGCHFQSEYRPLTKRRDRLTVDVSRNIPDAEIVEAMAGRGLSARLKDLEKELDKTLSEKLALEKRLAGLSGKEAEYEKRHGEMTAAMLEIEARLAMTEAAGGDIPRTDTEHRGEIARLLKVLDDMLEKLPQDIIDNFAQSEDFKLYERMLSLYLEEKE